MPETMTGKLGERYTQEYLKRKGYEIADVNFKSRFGEIDIIAKNDRYIAFVEVKTRKEDGLSHPFESITPAKRAKVIKTAQFYLMRQISSRALMPLRYLRKTASCRRSNT